MSHSVIYQVLQLLKQGVKQGRCLNHKTANCLNHKSRNLITCLRKYASFTTGDIFRKNETINIKYTSSYTELAKKVDQTSCEKKAKSTIPLLLQAKKL